MASEELPTEVLGIIFGYLGTLDRLAASSVCKQWYYASLNINLWRDAAIHISGEKATEGVNVSMNSERPFSCVVFKDCFEDSSSVSQDSCPLFLHTLEMCKVVGQRLSVLQFKNCYISGFHFAEILTECPNLQQLSAVNCESLFSSEIWLVELEEINRLKLSLQNVKELDLSYNKSMTDMFFARIAQIFTNVKSLSLAECPINFHGVVFRRFYPYPDIKPSNSILTFSWIKEFISHNASRITSINFNGTEIDDMALKALAHMEALQLECISLSRCRRLTGSGIRTFCHYQKKLKKLNLPAPIALEQVLPEICATLLELRELSVGSSWPPEKVPSLLALETHTLSKLVKLDLDSCCEIIVLKFIDSLRSEAYPGLRHLNLHKDKVDDYLFMYMIPYLLHITYLDLSGTLITDKGLIMISTHLVRLQVLHLSQCEAITDRGLIGHCETGPVPGEVMAEDTEGMSFGNREFLKWLVFDDHPVSISNLKGLRELNLYDISGISDEGVKVAVAFKELRCLSIGGSSEITDEGLLSIGKNNRSLEVLTLRNCSDVTENGLAKTLSYIPRLKLLDMMGCTNLIASALSNLAKKHSFRLKC